MVTSTTTTDLTWRLLWSHTARRVVSEIPTEEVLEEVTAGYGWGLRRSDNARCALLVHPTSQDRDIGDLSLTVVGHGTHVIARAGSSYQDYIGIVADAVEAAVHFYLFSQSITE